MALLSVLTPVLVAVLCLVIGFLLLRPRDPETTPPKEKKGRSAGADFRPWVDQDLQDDTETAKEDGMSKTSQNHDFVLTFDFIFWNRT